MSQLASRRRTYAIFVGIVATVLLGCLFYAKALRRNGPDAAVEKSPTATTVAAAATERRLLGAEATSHVFFPTGVPAKKSIYPPDVLQSIKRKNFTDLPQIDKSFASQMGDLEERAKNGDSQAALLLWNGLKQCADITNGYAEALLNSSGKPADNDPSARMPDSTGYVNDLLNDCANITGPQIAKRFDWLKQAAAEGNPQAQYYYAMAGTAAIGGNLVALQNPELWQDYRNTSIDYLNGLAESCNLTTISSLWDSFFHGNQIFAENAKQAYTMKLISDGLNVNGSPSLNAKLNSMFFPSLSPEEIQEATQPVQQFISDHCN